MRFELIERLQNILNLWKIESTSASLFCLVSLSRCLNTDIDTCCNIWSTLKTKKYFTKRYFYSIGRSLNKTVPIPIWILYSLKAMLNKSSATDSDTYSADRRRLDLSHSIFALKCVLQVWWQIVTQYTHPRGKS